MSTSIFSTNSLLILNNQEYRCPKCSLIPFIEISNNENKLFMSIKCINNHYYSEPFEKMEMICKTGPISNYTCENCENETNEKKKIPIFYYCSICFKFFCFKHGELHKLKENHKIFFNKKFDSSCSEHNGTTVIGYCSNHNKNYCMLCNHFEENNKKFDEKLNNIQIQYYENIMIKNEEIINLIENLFNNYKKIFKELENNFYIFKDNIYKKIKFMNEIINFYKTKSIECDINYQMKSNIENNFFNLSKINKNLLNKMNFQIKEMNEIILLLKQKDKNNNNNNKLNIINEIEKYKNFQIKNIKNFKILNNNKGEIYCIKVLEDGRIAAGDEYSNLIIYNKDTFNPDIIIKNNLRSLDNFIQLKNENLICSFSTNYTLKIIKIKNKEYENIQIIQNAHGSIITKIIELKNGNIITFSWDCNFKIWKLNNNSNEYENILDFKDSNYICDGIEIKDNEILYTLNTNQKSLVFYDLNKNEKIKTLNNLNLFITYVGERTIKLNNEEVVVSGNEKIYLIDINNYLILNEINCETYNYCILKLSNNLFLTGDVNGNINQYKIEKKQLIKETSKFKSHANKIWTMAILNDMIITAGNSNEIKIWKQ